MNDCSSTNMTITHSSYSIADCEPKFQSQSHPIVHVMLTVLPKPIFEETYNVSMPDLESDGLAFAAVSIPNEDAASDVEQMAGKALELIAKHRRRPERESLIHDPSPLDIGVKKSCWLLVQLDPAINWQFTLGALPCDHKDAPSRCENTHLRHVYLMGGEGHCGEVSNDGCQAFYFGVARRGPDAHCFMNFNIEFIHIDPKSGQKKRLKLIVDPDVKNDGGEDIDP